ncbi:tRNA (adenosine(37)-N6)-threonylcarbamoyltransferase complex dimerization subunit type 1 TsaB [Devosia sp. YIM 151766]|uniref:tRNA (adenosine(37)-N6)-threonylcarbamoyltransferase complex dimerization subunit type 1 TsaB n=1 Tax=Devosia sp. YIM 151766 TaxID=3017325 RepID=UPI00255C4ECB|nr:tRNA (adenosine(37)-N6)-threonylcarbamoyltransferase complex dimerization subunit type 1 TsaB [Devosia sp. YIM 151766]WIY52992.1 tRNA (adenosine(37)-N6)-threonylcarbamoyltransferase complex dimerization subunit type 1 TsaB [Devosia sp. YIM 151766]
MTQPVTLAIDTAAPRLQLAVVLPDGRTDILVEDIAKGHAEILFDRLATLLARNDLAYENIERVAVTTGPGSFTGLRIGLSAARGLGLARKVPVLGIPSLLAVSLAASSGPVAVLLDARRGEAYFETFPGPGILGSGPRLLPIETARAAIPADATLLETPFADIGAMARFAAGADPLTFPPHAAYIRDADAKPQDAARIPRRVP